MVLINIIRCGEQKFNETCINVDNIFLIVPCIYAI